RRTDLREERASTRDVRKVHRNALEDAARSLTGENLLLVGEQLREVYLDPAQRRRDGHAIRPRVESRRKVENCINTGRELPLYVLVEDERPHHPRPCVFCMHGHGGRDLLPTLACQPPRKGITKERVATLGLLRAEH